MLTRRDGGPTASTLVWSSANSAVLASRVNDPQIFELIKADAPGIEFGEAVQQRRVDSTVSNIREHKCGGLSLRHSFAVTRCGCVSVWAVEQDADICGGSWRRFRRIGANGGLGIIARLDSYPCSAQCRLSGGLLYRRQVGQSQPKCLFPHHRPGRGQASIPIA